STANSLFHNSQTLDRAITVSCEFGAGKSTAKLFQHWVMAAFDPAQAGGGFRMGWGCHHNDEKIISGSRCRFSVSNPGSGLPMDLASRMVVSPARPPSPYGKTACSGWLLTGVTIVGLLPLITPCRHSSCYVKFRHFRDRRGMVCARRSS